MKSILDPSFHYTSSSATDIRKTFDRVWNELRARERLQADPGFGRTTRREQSDTQPVRVRPVRKVAIEESLPVISGVALVGSRLRAHSR
jgi:hypothetical protein